jgi:nucleotide-binding universal stress UspA family protein
MNEAISLHRILVALDASPSSLAALEAAARLASELGAELMGLYVEEESLLRGADLPLTRVVGSFSGTLHPVGRREVEQQFRAQAAKARRAMEAVALRSRLRWSFRVARGGVAASVGAASTDADMITLGRGRALAGRRMGRTTASILESAGAPVLLLDSGLRPGQAVITVFDETPGAEAALNLGCILKTRDETPLFVVLRGSESRLDALEDSARAALRRVGVESGVQFFRLGRRDPALLTRLNPREGIGMLILPRPGALGKGVAELLNELRCPVLAIRKPSPGAD